MASHRIIFWIRHCSSPPKVSPIIKILIFYLNNPFLRWKPWLSATIWNDGKTFLTYLWKHFELFMGEEEFKMNLLEMLCFDEIRKIYFYGSMDTFWVQSLSDPRRKCLRKIGWRLSWIHPCRTDSHSVTAKGKANIFFLFNFFSRTQVLFVTPVLDFCWCLPWLLKPGCSSPVHNGFLRFTSGATPTDVFVIS